MESHKNRCSRATRLLWELEPHAQTTASSAPGQRRGSASPGRPGELVLPSQRAEGRARLLCRRPRGSPGSVRAKPRQTPKARGRSGSPGSVRANPREGKAPRRRRAQRGPRRDRVTAPGACGPGRSLPARSVCGDPPGPAPASPARGCSAPLPAAGFFPSTESAKSQESG